MDDFYKTETCIVWENGKPDFIEINPQEGRFGDVLIPASSVKGAISHRLAHHYNRLAGISIEGYIDQSFDLDSIGEFEFDESGLSLLQSKANHVHQAIENLREVNTDELDMEELEQHLDLFKANKKLLTEIKKDFNDYNFPEHQDDNNELTEAINKFQTKYSPNFTQFVGVENKAVQLIFGYSKKDDMGTETNRGNAILSDVYLRLIPSNEHIFNHIAIDRFTGGGIDGALFSEKAVTTQIPIVLDFYVSKDALDHDDANIKKAFQATLDDVTKGILPLGGRTTKGHGVFTGRYELINEA